MRFLGNIIWLIFGGFCTAIEYFVSGLALCLTIIGIPFGIQVMKLGLLALWPFGQDVYVVEERGGCLSTVFNVIWLLIGGIWICLTHLLFGFILIITIIGIPFGKQHFKLAGLALSPFGREIRQQMAFTPSTFKDQKHRSILLREATTDDAQDLIECISEYVQDSDFQVLHHYEFQPSTTEQSKWIQSFVSAENSILLVAIHNGKIIGNIELRGGNRQRIEHTAIIGMGIIEGYRFAGLGTRMMEVILEWAIDHPMIKHLWLQVFGNHQLAIALYERFGFKECGRQKDFIQKSDNSFVDKVNMCREV